MRTRRDLKCDRAVRRPLCKPCRSHLRYGWDGFLGQGELHSAREGHRQGLELNSVERWCPDVGNGVRTNDTGRAVADLVVLALG